MRRRLALVSLVLMLIAVARPAFAWTNGSDNGNGYATHDWILDHAVNLASSKGGWVDWNVAQQASDDPDQLTFPGHNVNEHLFRETLGAHGAPSRVSQLYYEIVTSLKAGDRYTASRDLGWLAHYYGDILQPFHTHTFSDMKWANKLHGDYELDVDTYTHSYDARGKYTITNTGRKSFSDIRTKTISAALFSRGKSASLASSLSTNGFDDRNVQSITSQVLNRAANDLADIIVSANDGSGLAAAPAKITTGVSKRYPANDTNIATTVKSLDASGRGMEGIAVTFTWHLASGDKSETSYSGPDGVATSWMLIGTNQLMQKYYVTWTVAMSGNTRTGTQWFVPTPKLADLQSGIYTTVSTHHPKVGSYIKASTLCRDTSGRPVRGLTVTFAWQTPTGTVKRTAVTDSYGYARSSYLTRSSDRNHKIWVKGYTMSGGINRSSSASFTPY